MKTEWDYTTLADAYLKRPAYSSDAIDEMLDIASIRRGSRVCDVGAGVAHLTLELAKRGLMVVAVEPNDAMRANGIKQTAQFPNVEWFEGTGEDTRQEASQFALVTFGSSFNVTNRALALKESKRILVPKGWFACMWNHRNLDDEVQCSIEEIIKTHVARYSYGTRREDQTAAIVDSKLFGDVTTIERPVLHTQSKHDCIEAWRSHATLQRQAGDKFSQVVSEIATYLEKLPGDAIKVPYTTRIWLAQLKA